MQTGDSHNAEQMDTTVGIFYWNRAQWESAFPLELPPEDLSNARTAMNALINHGKRLTWDTLRSLRDD